MPMSLQNHIHLDTTISENGEKAPSTKWKALSRVPDVQVYASVSRSITGKLQVQVASNDGELPTQFTNYEYTLKVTPTELATLVSMLGKHVYLVDHYHCADNADHSEYIRTMFFAQMGNIKPPAENVDVYYAVTISLLDADTVT